MEQQNIYNAANFAVGARWGPGSVGPDPAAGGPFSAINGTVITAQISSLLCPSDGQPGRAPNSDIIVGQMRPMPTAVCNYPSNIGLHRGYNNWRTNGPAYVISPWDDALKYTVTLQRVTDGTSNTAVFSEWVKGTGVGPNESKDGLGIVYHLPAGVPHHVPPAQLLPQYGNDRAAALACQSNGIQRAFTWKGEWAYYGGDMAYTHSQTPNRRSCTQGDFNRLGNLIAASSNHPGGVNVAMADGSVKFVKDTVNYLAWYALATIDGGEVVSSDAL